jgi:hypothetical protein
MSDKSPRVGDIVLIPVRTDTYAVAKVLFLSRRYKGVMLLGVSKTRTVATRTVPDPLPVDYELRIYTGVRLVGPDAWPVVGHDPSPVDPDVSRRRIAGAVWVGDEWQGAATDEDLRNLPEQGVAGRAAVENQIRRALGLGSEATGAAANVSSSPTSSVPPEFDDERGWALIEEAWKHAQKERKLRPGTAGLKTTATAMRTVDEALHKRVLPRLRLLLNALPQAELAQCDRWLERKLYDIDRAEIQQYTDGSDDGFLYARGFIVAIGRDYYELVSREPQRAVPDMECEAICYLPRGVYEEKFGTLKPSGISRETGSNRNGWKGRR